MVQKYVDELSKIIDITTSDNISESNLVVKHFFSGAAAYINEKIFCTYTPKGIAVKLSKEEREKLIGSKQGSELRYFTKAPIKRDYVLLNQEILEQTDELNYWIHIALDYVLKH